MPHDDWAPLLDDLAARDAAAGAMGGPDRLLQLAARGRLDVRTRIGLLVDPDSFVEYGALVGSVPRGALPPAPADAFVMGHATVGGRPVLVGAADPTVMGGSAGPGTIAKRRRLIAIADRSDRPLVLLLDGPGLRTRHPNDAAPWAGDDLADLARRRGPGRTVAVILGPVAGHDALLAAACDHVVMTSRAAVFGAGPPVVLATTGVEVTAGALGGPAVVHPVLVDHVAEDEAGAIAHVRERLGAEAVDGAGTGLPVDPVDVRSVLPADPDRQYDLDALMAAIVDPGSWSRVDATRSGLATGTARIGGVTLAVIGSDAAVDDGRIDGAGASAARARVARAETAGEALLVIVDSPGPALGAEAESAGTLRAVVELARAVRATPVPVVAVLLRRAHGDVPTILGLGAGGPTVLSVATPALRLGPLPAETASEAVGIRADVAALVAHTEFGGAIDAADRLVVDRVVDPDALRGEVIAALRLA